jgi:hypothetical protein
MSRLELGYLLLALLIAGVSVALGYAYYRSHRSSWRRAERRHRKRREKAARVPAE